MTTNGHICKEKPKEKKTADGVNIFAVLKFWTFEHKVFTDCF